VVKWFDPHRDVGVLARDDGGPDAVADRSAVQGDADRTLVPGQRVLFDITFDASGVRADNIRLNAATTG
jgi:cold shock CspA family protein